MTGGNDSPNAGTVGECAGCNVDTASSGISGVTSGVDEDDESTNGANVILEVVLRVGVDETDFVDKTDFVDETDFVDGERTRDEEAAGDVDRVRSARTRTKLPTN
jgi:hypothetical protein